MKLSVGNTYEEAVSLMPYTGIRSTDEAQINQIRSVAPVVLEYKLVKKVNRYRWVFKGPYTYTVFDTVAHDMVRNEEHPDKPKFFKSIRLAMIWIYNHDKESFDAIPNISIWTPVAKTPAEEGSVF